MNILLRLLIDLALLSFFSVGHTVLLNSIWRVRIAKIVPSQLFFTIYGLHSAFSLILMFVFWQKLPGNIWSLTGWAQHFVEALMGVSWLFMGYSLFCTGVMKHIGTAQWIHYLKKEVTPNQIIYGGAYKWCRHPIFLAFFGMIWFTPNMTIGHLLVTLYWSVYLILGTLWKEEPLMRNKTYQEYLKRVPAYPFFPLRPFKETFSSKNNVQGVPT